MGIKAGPAARKFHFVGHSMALTGQVIGAVVGAVVGAIVAIGLALTGVGAVLCVAALLTGIGLGASLGKFVAGWIEGIESGKIKEGAATVFYGPEGLNAARIKNKLDCNDPLRAAAAEVVGEKALPLLSPAFALGMGSHAGAFINEGVWKIFLEPPGYAASRIESKTSCGGKITKGIDSIILCGPPIYVIHPNLCTEDSALMNWFLFVVDVANTALGLGAAKTGGKVALILTQLGIKTASQILKQSGQPGAARVLDVIDSGIGLVTGVKGGSPQDIVGGLVGESQNIKDQYGSENPETTREMEEYSRRMQRGTEKNWFETQYQLEEPAPAR